VTTAGIASSRRALLDAATARLAAAGIATARVEAEWLLAGLSGVGRASLAADRAPTVDEDLAARYETALARRERREPLQRILGWEEFWGLRFALSADVLVPRPETELLVQIALTLLPPPAARRPLVLDVGTGSGCIACSLAHQRPDARVIALDHSLPAVALAQHNAAALGMADTLRCVASSLLDAIAREQIDLIVGNLPYLPTALLPVLAPEVRDHEPRQALDGGPDGLDVIRTLIADAPRTLRRPGAIALETAGTTQAPQVATLLEDTGFTDIAIHPDLTNTDRFVTAHWTSRGGDAAVRAPASPAQPNPGGRHRKGGEAPLRGREAPLRGA
jgi:release factor glutamine methyltransferase